MHIYIYISIYILICMYVYVVVVVELDDLHSRYVLSYFNYSYSSMLN